MYSQERGMWGPGRVERRPSFTRGWQLVPLTSWDDPAERKWLGQGLGEQAPDRQPGVRAQLPTKAVGVGENELH